MTAMNQSAIWIAWLAAAYLAGSIPFGLIIGRARHVDIRQHGSGNIGATNVGRVLGRRWGILCFVLDVAKGFTPVFACCLVAPLGREATPAAVLGLLVAAMAMLGHIFPVWLRFRGGKGVATGLGVLLGLWPILTIPAVIAGIVWFVVVRAIGYVSVASMAAAAALPFLTLASALYHQLPLGQTVLYLTVATALATLVIWRHRSNVAKLRAGTETKASWASREATGPQ